MPFKKGKPRPKKAGRKKGTPNKTTASIKEAIMLAFDGIGGLEKLTEWARDNETEFYKIWAKLLPQELQHSGPNGKPIQFQAHEYSDAEIEARIADLAKRAIADGVGVDGGTSGTEGA